MLFIVITQQISCPLSHRWYSIYQMADEMAGIGADHSYVQLLSSASKDEKKSPPEVNGMKDGLFNGGLVCGCN